MKKIFSYWVLCLMAFATSALVSCSSDDNGDQWEDLSLRMFVMANCLLLRIKPHPKLS